MEKMHASNKLPQSTKEVKGIKMENKKGRKKHFDVQPFECAYLCGLCNAFFSPKRIHSESFMSFVKAFVIAGAVENIHSFLFFFLFFFFFVNWTKMKPIISSCWKTILITLKEYVYFHCKVFFDSIKTSKTWFISFW